MTGSHVGLGTPYYLPKTIIEAIVKNTNENANRVHRKKGNWIFEHYTPLTIVTNAPKLDVQLMLTFSEHFEVCKENNYQKKLNKNKRRTCVKPQSSL